MGLEGKVALVTGGSRGIGRAAALALAEEGADVAVNYVSNSEAADEVTASIRHTGRKALACRADVSDSEEVRAMVELVKESLGPVQVLVNNAGVVLDSLVTRMSPEAWSRVLEVNLTGAFHCSKAVLPQMVRHRWGRIINISSAVASMGNAGQANYAASKAGLLGFTRSLAREYCSRNILVNAVSPGLIRTDMTAGRENLAVMAGMVPMGRTGTCEEVASAVVFLAGPASYTTGSVLEVNGGLVM